MTKIGYNGWLQVNITAKDRSNMTRPLAFTRSHSSIQELSFTEAADYTAKLIAEKYDNIHLLLSGGVDSEFVAQTLVRNKLPFKPVIFLFSTSVSEAWYAFKFCEENNLTPIVFDYRDYDLADEFVSQCLKISLQVGIPPILATCSLVLAQLIPDAHILNGYGEMFKSSPNYHDTSPENVLDLCFNQHYLEVAHGDAHPGAFFTYTPELMYASINEFDYAINSQVAKAKLYNVIPRSKIDISELSQICSPKMQEYLKKVFNTHPVLALPLEYRFLYKTKEEWLEFLNPK